MKLVRWVKRVFTPDVRKWSYNLAAAVNYALGVLVPAFTDEKQAALLIIFGALFNMAAANVDTAKKANRRAAAAEKAERDAKAERRSESARKAAQTRKANKEAAAAAPKTKGTSRARTRSSS